MREVVKEVAKYFPTAIISGRSRDKVIGWFLFTWFVLIISLAIVYLFAFKYPWSLLISAIACPTLLFIQVYEFVRLKELYYAGSHGMDIMGPVRQYISDDHTNCVRSVDEQVRG
jgi:trehalose 6-phosphate phosphatase